ncbi:unnamed protein product [Phytophthora fragariaefolia]|uniref:Unnamed protein product n=1 Tax=Phytophthora fragariaefolia TaxID=1490495 RepID=A0A9W7DCT4_9STRA|nr:unnamed protein product [Phytophthora fragariaefolia]
MGGTESNEVAKDDARLQHPMVIRSPPAQQQQDKKPGAAKDGVTTAADGSKTAVSTAKDGTTTAVTTSADGSTVTTVVTKPDGSSETTTEIVTTTETEVDVTMQQQGVSPTAAAVARAVADFESVSEEKHTTQSLAELAWHAWSASATAAAMGVEGATAETLRALNANSGVLFTSTVVVPQPVASGEMTSLEAGGERRKEDFKRCLPDFLTKTNAVLMDEANVENESAFEFIALHRRLSLWLQKIIVISLLRDSSEDCTRAKHVIVLQDGEVIRCGSWSEIIKYVQELGLQCPSQKDVAMCLSDKKATAALFDQSDSTVRTTKVVRLADEVVFLSESSVVKTPAESDCYLVDVGNFNKVQTTSSSKQLEALEKPSIGAFMYELQMDGRIADSDKSDDEDAHRQLDGDEEQTSPQ